MKQIDHDPTTKMLVDFFNIRKVRNSSYSYRALSRDLGIPQSTLSNVLSGKMRMNAQLALKIGLKLKLSEKDLVQILVQLSQARTRRVKTK